jgi:hypothetical protein
MAAKSHGSFRRLLVGERVVCTNARSRYYGQEGTVSVEEKPRSKLQAGEFAFLRVMMDGGTKDLLFIFDEVQRVTKTN